MKPISQDSKTQAHTAGEYKGETGADVCPSWGLQLTASASFSFVKINGPVGLKLWSGELWGTKGIADYFREVPVC